MSSIFSYGFIGAGVAEVTESQLVKILSLVDASETNEDLCVIELQNGEEHTVSIDEVTITPLKYKLKESIGKLAEGEIVYGWDEVDEQNRSDVRNAAGVSELVNNDILESVEY